jgi:hypothetical protein
MRHKKIAIKNANNAMRHTLVTSKNRMIFNEENSDSIVLVLLYFHA